MINRFYFSKHAPTSVAGRLMNWIMIIALTNMELDFRLDERIGAYTFQLTGAGDMRSRRQDTIDRPAKIKFITCYPDRCYGELMRYIGNSQLVHCKKLLMNNNILKIKEWIISQSPELPEFDENFNLIEHRAFDSLQFLELINMIEELSGRMVDTAEINVADFLTLNAIENKFFN